MLGIGKKVKRVQIELGNALTKKAESIVLKPNCSPMNAMRAQTLLDIAEIVSSLGVEVEDDKD